MDKQALKPDLRGVFWDAALYVPTVGLLAFYGLGFWYGGKHMSWAYLLWFMACFFAISGASRILRRLLVLPGAPVGIEVDRRRKITVHLKGGRTVDLLRDVRYFKDYAGRSFGLSGVDGEGKKWQFVFHRGQFPDEPSFTRINKVLEAFS